MFLGFSFKGFLEALHWGLVRIFLKLQLMPIRGFPGLGGSG